MRERFDERQATRGMLCAAAVGMSLAIAHGLPLLGGSALFGAVYAWARETGGSRQRVGVPPTCRAVDMLRDEHGPAVHLPVARQPNGPVVLMVYADRPSQRPLCHGPCFDIIDPGNYTVVARLRLEQQDRDNNPVNLRADPSPVEIEVEAHQLMPDTMPGTATLARRAMTFETGTDFTNLDAGFTVSEGDTREVWFLVWLRSPGLRLWVDDLMLHRQGG